MKPSGPSVVELEAEVARLRRALDEAKSAATPAEPPPGGVTKRRDTERGTWVLDVGDVSDEEAELYGAVLSEFMRARQTRLDTALSGATIVRCDEARGTERAVRGSIEVSYPRRKIG